MTFAPELGPLGPLLGVWEGERGTDLSPSDKPDNNRAPVTSRFRERMVFEATGRVDNHEQKMYGLRYSTRAWRIDAPDAFHEELGYYMWDPASGVLLRSFMPPRGIAVLAGATVAASAREFTLEATAGSEVFGICSSPFLIEEFKTVRYTAMIRVLDDNTFEYDAHTYMQMKGRPGLFDHRDQNTLRRTS